MATDLLDINVWLALVDENHQHHASARDYWQQYKADRVAFCRVSMLGLLRLSTQTRVLSRALNHDEAWDIYRRYMALPTVQFLAEPANLEQHFAALTLTADLPHRMWTDSYLAAFALASKSRLVSFDGDFKRFAGLDFLHLKHMPSASAD
jgi:toxin-antitoxin system PIN domain toxin